MTRLDDDTQPTATGVGSESTAGHDQAPPVADPAADKRLRAFVRRLPGGGRLLAYLAIAGPGLIAANAGNDAGGIATYSSAGSQFVYRTLFFMVLVTVALVLGRV
jgi:hypothetical protein